MIRLTRSQVREIDRRSIEEFQIPGVVLMENASRAVADATGQMLARLDGARTDPGDIVSEECDLIIDAIFGTGLSKPPRAPFDQIVMAVEKRAVPVLAVDIPSGLDCDTGNPLGPTIRATRTVTFVAEKA